MAKALGFRIAARALRQLGAELITSDEIALNELIKNALDAKSNRVSIRVENPFKYSRSAAIDIFKCSDVDGYVKCFDDLFSYEIDHDTKLKFKNLIVGSQAKDIKKNICEMYDELCHITISDNGFGMNKDTLQDSFLVIGTPSKWIEKQSDTDSQLLGEKGVGRLSMMRLGRYSIVSSGVAGADFENKIKFDWSLFDDPGLYLDQVAVPVVKGGRKNIELHGTTILIKGVYAHWDSEKISKFISEYLRRLQNPFSKKVKFPIDVYLNGERQPIERLASWFKNAANITASVTFSIDENENISLRRTLQWRGKTSAESRLWQEDDLLREVSFDKNLLLSLGGFQLDLLWFNRGDLNGASIDHSVAQIKDELNLWCGGYAIYRDNFRIGLTGSLEDDWLKVDTGSLKSKGFSFNRYQTVGALSISQKENPNLIDSANREKLINCDELDLLKDLLSNVVNKDIKSYIEFYKENEFKKASVESTAESTLEDATDRLKRARVSAAKLKKVIPKEQKNVVEEIEFVLKTQYENIRKYQNAMKLSKEQRIEVLELAGLGMIVDKVIHELARLTEQTTENLKKLETGSDRNSINIIKIIREQISVTNKRIRTVDSLSPSGRNRKEVIDLPKIVMSVIDGFSGRLARHNTTITLTVDDKKVNASFNVNMVLGLVALVLENLLANSIYWLQQGLVLGDHSRHISINIDTKDYTLSVRDNGPGVDPSLKDEIFRPYFTNRKNGKGLGLFICREIAEYHQCSIYIDTLPEDDGRLRTFVLELPRK